MPFNFAVCATVAAVRVALACPSPSSPAIAATATIPTQKTSMKQSGANTSPITTLRFTSFLRIHLT
jgi:hypothetical protein